jgi:hypothetical protein
MTNRTELLTPDCGYVLEGSSLVDRIRPLWNFL